MTCEPCKDARREAQRIGSPLPHAAECAAHAAITRAQLRLMGRFKHGNRWKADIHRCIDGTAKMYTRRARWLRLEASRRYDSWARTRAYSEAQTLLSEWAREYGPGTADQLSERAGKTPKWWMTWLDERERELRTT